MSHSAQGRRNTHTHTDLNESFGLFNLPLQSSPAGACLSRPDRHLPLKDPATNNPETGALAPVLPKAQHAAVSQRRVARSQVKPGATVRALSFGGGSIVYFQLCPITSKSAARLWSSVVVCQQRADSALDWSISPMQQYFQATQGCINAAASSTSHMTVVPSELVFYHKTPTSSSVSVTSSQPVTISNYTGEKLRWVISNLYFF